MRPGRAPLPPEATALYGEPLSTGPGGRNRLAAVIRRLSELVVGRPMADADLDGAADEFERIADALERAATPGKRPRGLPDAAGHPQDFFPTSPMIGFANPIAPPVDLWAVEGEGGLLELRGRAFFTYPYEGPPTCVHGGVIAELMDELLGSANIITNQAGMTGTLTVKYRRPTPLLAELDLVARQTGTEGRKIFAWGGIYHEGTLTAEAEGIFIRVDPSQMLSIVNANAKEATGEVVDARLQAFVDQGGNVVGTESTLGAEGPHPA